MGTIVINQEQAFYIAMPIFLIAFAIIAYPTFWENIKRRGQKHPRQ